MDFFNTLTLGNLSLDPSAILDPSNPRRPWNPRPLDDPLLPLMLKEDRRGVGRLPSVKGFNKTMSSSLGESNMCMMVRSSSKLFWNGVLDRIIHFLVQSLARAFRISLFGRPLLKFVPKSELSYLGLRSETTLESFVASCTCYFRLMMNTWFC